MPHRFVVSNPEKCVGCQLCEYVCSAVKEKSFNPMLSRIRVVRIDPVVSMSIACRLCEDPTCVVSCPRKALTANQETGVIIVDEDKCNGCGWCIEACEFGAIFLHSGKKIVFACDLCAIEKEPKCVKFCPKDALEFMTVEEVAQKARKKAVKKLLEELIKS